MSIGSHQIVVVGGGAGGIELVTRLGNDLGKKGLAKITLLDKQETHLWKPLLHEVAAGTMDSNIDQLNFFAHSTENYYHYQPGAMTALDRAKKCISIAAVLDDQGNVIVPERTLKYDTLVIAVGSQSNDFNTPGVKEFCLSIDSLDQANFFHKKYVDKLLCAQFAENGKHASFDIVIIGAGATGIELSAELHQTLAQTEHYHFNKKIIEGTKITVIEGAPRILPVLPDLLSTLTTQKLKSMGIEILTGEIVTRIDEKGVHTKSGKSLSADICVWAAGVKAPDFLRTLDGLEVDNVNRLMAKDTLQTTMDDNIFVLGDCGNVTDAATGKPVPPRAQTAHQQASLLAISLRNRLLGKPLPDFEYKDRGSLVALSCYGTYGDISSIGKMRYMVGGRIARMMYRSLYFMHLSTLHGLWGAFVFKRAKKMLGRTRPRVKLHFSKY